MSEISFFPAKNSELIFTVNDLALCSGYNPTLDAEQWVERNANFWAGVHTIFVLGVGCGYHLTVLARRSRSNVIGLDISKNIIAAALKIHPLDLQESKLLHFSSLDDLEHATIVKKSVQTRYTTLIYEPSVFSNPELFSQAKRFLNGRSKRGLLWLLRQRNLASLDFLDTADVSMSIKSLDSVIDDFEPSPILKSVRELVV